MSQNGINSVRLLGNLTHNAELRYTQSGQVVATIRLATNESFYNRTTQARESKTEYHTLVGWGKRYEALFNKGCLDKGQQVAVHGRLQTRSFDGNDGVKRWTTEVVIKNMDEDFILLGTPRRGQDAPPPTDEDSPLPPPVESDKDKQSTDDFAE